MHVLVVEDDAALAQYLGQALRLDGHDVECVSDGDAAIEYAAERRPDLMILDLGLPGKDGMDVLAEMKTRFRTVSVLVLTGRGVVGETVLCLRTGADDVMLKPFSFHELAARCESLGRRRAQFSDPVLRFGGVEMDRLARRVTNVGRELELTMTEFALLESLLLRRGRPVGRDELLREVWRGGLVGKTNGTNIVEVYINYLRKKLGRAAGSGGIAAVIRTVRGEGYALTAPERLGEWGHAGSRQSGESAAGEGPYGVKEMEACLSEIG